ncbi:hypothetical protein ACHAWF_011078 [Thalassiosira exigua]
MDIKRGHCNGAGQSRTELKLNAPVILLRIMDIKRGHCNGAGQSRTELKLNAPVILLRIMDIKRGHCNGTRYLVKAIGDYCLVLTKMGAKDDDPNKTLILPRIPMRANDYGLPFELKQLQFPVKPAFALTINRGPRDTHLTSVGSCSQEAPGHTG